MGCAGMGIEHNWALLDSAGSDCILGPKTCLGRATSAKPAFYRHPPGHIYAGRILDLFADRYAESTFDRDRGHPADTFCIAAR